MTPRGLLTTLGAGAASDQRAPSPAEAAADVIVQDIFGRMRPWGGLLAPLAAATRAVPASGMTPLHRPSHEEQPPCTDHHLNDSAALR